MIRTSVTHVLTQKCYPCSDCAQVGEEFSVGRWTLDVGRSPLPHARPRCKTSRSHPARTRLGLFWRSAQDIWKSRGRRGHFAERRTRSPDRQRDLQQQIANRGSAVFAAATGSGSRFFPAQDRASHSVSETAWDRSPTLSARLERE